MTPRPVLLASLASLALSASALAVPYGTTADFTGTRTEGAGIVTGGDYVADGGKFEVSWVITSITGGYRYEYTFDGYVSPAISHFILDLTDDCVTPGDPACVTNVVYNGDPLSYEINAFGPSPSNPGFPDATSIVGVKFDNTVGAPPFKVSFESNRAPVWGDFFVKGGSASYAYNAGLTDHDSADVNDFIARPNGVVPEPGTLAMLGLGLAGLRQWSRRKRS
jgi:hypothetical protein